MFDHRLIATAIMWGVAAIVAVSGMVFNASEFWALVLPLGAACLGTMAVWAFDAEKAESEAKHGGARLQDIEKTKRDPDAKMRMLLEMMDEDERQAFKESLKRQMLRSAGMNDGELEDNATSLESLLGEQEKRLRR